MPSYRKHKYLVLALALVLCGVHLLASDVRVYAEKRFARPPILRINTTQQLRTKVRARLNQMDTAVVDCDFLIVGAGSSGCVLASRLVRQGLKVLLVEQGPADDGRLRELVRRPSQWMAAAFSGNAVSEIFFTEPQGGLGNRRLHAFRGRGGGGTSNINAGLYCRGRCVLKPRTLLLILLYQVPGTAKIHK